MAITRPEQGSAAPSIAADRTHVSARGCAFLPRCPRAKSRCSDDEPALLAVAPEHRCACHYAAGADMHAELGRTTS
jgi:oligopeptide/dipeptide ABC transporter ATP-binding protein